MISDQHAGLVKAVREQLLGSAWQRCRVDFTRNAQDLVPRSARSMVATVIRSIFEQPDEAQARAQLRRVVDGLTARFPAIAELLADAEPDLLVHFTFPDAHRRQIRSTNPLGSLATLISHGAGLLRPAGVRLAPGPTVRARFRECHGALSSPSDPGLTCP